MLAGRMKLKNFVLVVTALAAAAVAGLYFTCRGNDEPAVSSAGGDREADDRGGDSRATRATANATANATAEPTAEPAARPGSMAEQPAAANLRPVDQLLMSYRGKALGAKKRKDVTRGEPYKVNLYQDSGHGQVNRAKVDLDRDDKWDEKWTFDGDRVTRKVAPQDDENYTRSYLWDGAAWAPE